MVKNVQKYCTVIRPKTKRVLAGRFAHGASHRQTDTKVRCIESKNGIIKNREGINNNNFVSIRNRFVKVALFGFVSVMSKDRLAWRNNGI